MSTLWNESDRTTLVERVARLSAQSRPHWGSFDAPRMLVHVTDAIKMATGELVCAPERGLLRYPLVRQLVMFYLPWPKGAPTAPALLARQPADWNRELTDFRVALDRFAARDRTAEWPEHPAFGPLAGSEWGRLMHRHIDHHLRQFGV